MSNRFTYSPRSLIHYRLRFTLRTSDGRIIAVAETPPIKITDDHKTDRTKPRQDGMNAVQPQPAVPRSRKGRQSAASSRRQSPAPSEGDSIQSHSETGALTQKQTPSVRAAKPYERPTFHSPYNGTILPDGFQGYPEAPIPKRQLSASSIHSVASMSALPIKGEIGHPILSAGPAEFPTFEQPYTHGTVSPGALRRPLFNGFTALDGSTSYSPSASHSASSSNVASPVSMSIPLYSDELAISHHQLQSPQQLMQAFRYANHRNTSQALQIPLVSSQQSDHTDVDMANAVGVSLDNLFDASTQISGESSHADVGSGLYSESGLPPVTDDMTNFLDFSGGFDQNLIVWRPEASTS